MEVHAWMKEDAVSNGPPIPGMGLTVKVPSAARLTVPIWGRRADAIWT